MASSLAVLEVVGKKRDSGGDGSGSISGSRALTPELATVTEDSSESDGETEPAKSFHRRLSTNRDIKCSASLKEGYLLKQTWSFQRWRRRYFKLRGRKLYYAKDTKAVIFDEIELTDLCLAECSTKNVNHSFQVITPFRSLVLCADSRREMEDWLGALGAASQRRFHEPDQPDCLSGNHHWYATSHARPTYCNVCRDALSGVTSHGLSCEVCKCKVHKRCAAKAINNCKWTTLASVGKDIIEDEDGNISMPHQWMEGNLPVSAKCAICDKNCGSVLRLQDWRCLWCRSTVHTQCRPSVRGAGCPLGGNRVSIVPPTALHSSQDEAWEAVRPLSSSPLLVFVNSKSGDNQGVKFLRRFKQQLNPAQVFDLISTGPRLGLRLFRPFHPFRILVCSGDGSVGWVMSEIDKLNMQKQCQVGVLPLGTGNDLSRTLGWGSSCDDDTHLPQLLEKYEKACVKILDRWSIMTFERTIAMPKLSLIPGQTDGILHAQITQYEDNLCTYLQNILQSDETSVVLSSAKRLCETVKDFAQQVADSQLIRVDDQLGKKCDILQQKLDILLQTLTSDQLTLIESSTTTTCTQVEYDEEDMPKPPVSIHTTGTSSSTVRDDTESEISYERKSDKSEKDLSNFNFRKHRRTSRSCEDLELLCWFRFMEREKDALIMRANSLKRAIRNLVEHTESVVEAHSEKTSIAAQDQDAGAQAQCPSGGGSTDDGKKETLKVLHPTESGSSTDVSSCPSPTGSVITARLVSLSPMPDIRRDSASSEDPDMLDLPVPPDFADSRRSSQIQQAAESAAVTDRILQETVTTLSHTIVAPTASQDTRNITDAQRRDSILANNNNDDEKECSSILSAISCEVASIVSETDDDNGHSFCPRKNSDGDDQNGHIGHIDSPETDPGSDAFLPGESLMDDLSSMLGADMYGNDLDSMENTIAEDTTTTDTTTDIQAALMTRRKNSLRGMRSSLKRRLSGSRMKTNEPPMCNDDDEFGFENKAFTSQLVYLMNEDEPIKYCSLAAFVEGNDIARKSFKVKSKPKADKTVQEKGEHECKEKECGEIVLDDDKSIKGSKTSLNKLVKELSNLSEKDEDVSDHLQFPRFSMVVEPPSPDKIKANSTNNNNNNPQKPPSCGMTYSLTPPAIDVTATDCATSVNNSSNPSDTSSNSNLLNFDNEHFLTASPAATRRISCCSMLNANEAAILAAAAATSKFYDDHSKKDHGDHHKTDKKNDTRKLPIINPLVQLPTWPSKLHGEDCHDVSTGTTGFIGKCLLANADTLCAAVSPLIDPDDAVMEGFLERCVMNNYFGIGIDAKISLDFHHKREEHPEKCRSRAKNYMWYGVLGSKQIIQKTYKNLAQRVQLECDGQRIPLPSLQGIVILNIPSFMGGINFWGSSKEGEFLPPSFDDKILEVVAVFGSMQMAASRLINLQHHRIAQCQSIQINILGDEGVPIQVDGEAWIQPPGIIRILHKNRMQMLCRNRTLENSLRTWEEKQRHHSSMSAQGSAVKQHRGSLVSTGNHDKGRSSLTRQSMPGATASGSNAHAERSFLGAALDLKVRQHSFSGSVSAQERHLTVTFMDKPMASNNRGPEILFSDEEQHLLLYFIEVATNLAKWIKILAISHTLDTDLYTLADKTEQCLEKIHPKGKILQGNTLRVEFTKLVNSVKTLYEESCCLLHERQDKLKLREDLENKLSMSLANTEMELRKCVLYDTDEGSLVYLQPLQEDQSEHKRKGLFWLKFRSRSASLSAHAHPTAAQRTAGDWGTQEVATWLDTLQLTEYVDTFVKNDIRGRELLTLARRDLKELGVTKVGHVKRILQAVKDLSQGN